MKKRLRRSLSAKYFFHLALVFSFLIFGAATSWAQFVVTNTNNGGPGSLRQAILDARSDPAPNVITFDPTVFPATINLTSLLPVLNSPGDTIDGAGNVTLNAVNLTADTDHGIRIFAGDITIRGLTIQNFGGDGIRVQPNPNALGGQSGQDITGVEISGNKLTENDGFGIRVFGGEDTNDVQVTISGGNVVSNNRDGGIVVFGSNSAGTGLNSVNVTINSNVIRGGSPIPKTPSNSLGGDGIGVVGGNNFGNNDVRLIISNNTVQNVFGEGLRVAGAGPGSSSINNIIIVDITGNNIQNSGLGTTGAGNGITVAGGPTIAVPATTSGNMVTFFVDDNQSLNNRDNGIRVLGNNGSNHVVRGTISNNTFQGNGLSGINLVGQGSSTIVENIDIQFNNVTNNGQGGLFLFGGDSPTANATIRNVFVDGNRFDGNNFNGISVSRGTGAGNVISFSGITNNSMSRNGSDGLFIPAGVNGSATPITGNRADRNGIDGIDLNSTGYVVSNNTASRNGGDGINLGGNADGGGNTARNNGGCNIC